MNESTPRKPHPARLSRRAVLTAAIGGAALVGTGAAGYLLRGDDGEAAHTSPNPMVTAYPAYSEGGYADKRTVVAGETITFFLGSGHEQLDAQVLFVGGDGVGHPVKALKDLQPNAVTLPASPEDGCAWEPTYQLTVPLDWHSGWYRLEMPTLEAGEARYVDFIVAEPERRGDVLYIFDMQTAMAYNVYAGASIYGGFDAKGRWATARAATKVSWMRPIVRSHNYDAEARQIAAPIGIPHEGELFRQRLEAKFKVAYVSNDSLERMGLDYLARYPAMVIAGTQEYWSKQQLDLVKRYVRQGGNLYLSAEEFAYGAIRSEQDGEVIRFFNDAREDLASGTKHDDLAVTRGLIDNLQDFFGVSLAYGYALTTSDVFSPLRVVDEGSWAFEGLGYKRGDEIAGVRGIGVGAWVKQENGRYFISSAAIPRENVEVLAIAEYEPLAVWPALLQLDEDIGAEFLNVPESTPDKTYAILALIRQGKGQIFVAPGGWFNLMHEHNLDPRVPLLIERVIARFCEGVVA